MDSSNLQDGAICGIGAITLPIALCLALFLNRLCPSSNSYRFPFLHPPVFARHHRKGGLVSLESPAPYGGILTTRVVRIPPRISSPSVRCLPAALFFGYVFPHHHGTLWTFSLSARIASVVPGKLLSIFMERSFLN